MGAYPQLKPRPGPLRVALLDRDPGLRITLANRFERFGWTHRTVPVGTAAPRLRTLPVDVLVVDLAAVGPQRWEWLTRLCRGPLAFAVVICTGASTPADRVRALRLGADEWLGKPCHPEELTARIEAVARHLHRPRTRPAQPIRVGELEIRPDAFQAFVGEHDLRLTRRELQLITLFARSPETVLERALVYKRIWGYEMLRDDRSVDVLVYKLRRKLTEASPTWHYIHTHTGVGYSFAAQPLDDLLELRDRRRRRHAKVLLAA
jgi:DNA-binding response OmpR family regulator